MPDISVEEAVKQNCQALLIGDLMRVMNDLTPEAMAQLMQGGGNMGAMPALKSFDIQSHEQQGDDHCSRSSSKAIRTSRHSRRGAM